MIDYNRKIARAEAELKDAIENRDRKGRWYAEGKRDALQNCRLEESVNSGAQSDREVAIGEDAFKTGYNLAAQRAVDFAPVQIRSWSAHREKAWSDYTPPETIR